MRMSHKDCGGVVTKSWIGRDEIQFRCAYCKKVLEKKDIKFTREGIDGKGMRSPFRRRGSKK